MAEKRKRTSSKNSTDAGGIISGLVEQVTSLAGETSRIAGEVLGSAGSVANTARETGAEWVEGVSPTAAELLRNENAGRAASRAKTHQDAIARRPVRPPPEP